ncbi:hypothetical protein DCAR_0205718 [Daucus carota subsp. sativus]|uniref:Uncharacterized protein n=1 Tax=Daucus carota subsp. sativus TaxID=79200 RepID=A0A175YBH7_DAUCS|nr:hypothetical protein DCAR_0205718 [Daucus carota subsp. sativus]
MGREVRDRLYTLNRMVGPLEELIDWDMGPGVDHPNFIDVRVPEDAPDLVNFNAVVGIAENGAPEAVPAEQMMANGGVPTANPGTTNGGVQIQENVPPFVFDEPINDHEKMFQPGAATGFLFAGDPPLEEID